MKNFLPFSNSNPVIRNLFSIYPFIYVHNFFIIYKNTTLLNEAAGLAST